MCPLEAKIWHYEVSGLRAQIRRVASKGISRPLEQKILSGTAVCEKLKEGPGESEEAEEEAVLEGKIATVGHKWEGKVDLRRSHEVLEALSSRNAFPFVFSYCKCFQRFLLREPFADCRA